MQRLSRRFSGFVFLYMAIAQVLFVLSQNLFIYAAYGSIFQNSKLVVLLFRVLMLLPPVILIAVNKYPFTAVLRINTFSAKQLMFAAGISLFLFLFVSLFKEMIGKLIDSFFLRGFYNPHSFFNWYIDLWPSRIASCLVPGVLYELSFRGVIQSGFFGMSAFKACAVVGALNGLMYTGVSDVLPYAIFGFVLCYMSIKTGSIIPGMITALLFQLFRAINIGGIIYSNLLSPIGLNETAAAGILAVLSVFIVGLLLKAMPNKSGSSHPFASSDFKRLFAKLKSLRERVKLSWLPDTEASRPAPSASETPTACAPEVIVFPDDSDRQKKNTGFIIGSVMLIALTLLSLGLKIYYAIEHAGTLFS